MTINPFQDVTVLEPVDLPPKFPYDEVPYQLDFEDVLPEDDEIDTIVDTVIGLLSDDAGSETDIPLMHIGPPAADGTVAQQMTGGGTSGLWYKLRVRIVSVAGLHLERCGKFFVVDR